MDSDSSTSKSKSKKKLSASAGRKKASASKRLRTQIGRININININPESESDEFKRMRLTIPKPIDLAPRTDAISLKMQVLDSSLFSNQHDVEAIDSIIKGTEEPKNHISDLGSIDSNSEMMRLMIANASHNSDLCFETSAVNGVNSSQRVENLEIAAKSTHAVFQIIERPLMNDIFRAIRLHDIPFFSAANANSADEAIGNSAHAISISKSKTLLDILEHRSTHSAFDKSLHGLLLGGWNNSVGIEEKIESGVNVDADVPMGNEETKTSHREMKLERIEVPLDPLNARNTASRLFSMLFEGDLAVSDSSDSSPNSISIDESMDMDMEIDMKSQVQTKYIDLMSEMMLAYVEAAKNSRKTKWTTVFLEMSHLEISSKASASANSHCGSQRNIDGLDTMFTFSRSMIPELPTAYAQLPRLSLSSSSSAVTFNHSSNFSFSRMPRDGTVSASPLSTQITMLQHYIDMLRNPMTTIPVPITAAVFTSYPNSNSILEHMFDRFPILAHSISRRETETIELHLQPYFDNVLRIQGKNADLVNRISREFAYIVASRQKQEQEQSADSSLQPQSQSSPSPTPKPKPKFAIDTLNIAVWHDRVSELVKEANTLARNDSSSAVSMYLSLTPVAKQSKHPKQSKRRLSHDTGSTGAAVETDGDTDTDCDSRETKHRKVLNPDPASTSKNEHTPHTPNTTNSNSSLNSNSNAVMKIVSPTVQDKLKEFMYIRGVADDDKPKPKPPTVSSDSGSSSSPTKLATQHTSASPPSIPLGIVNPPNVHVRPYQLQIVEHAMRSNTILAVPDTLKNRGGSLYVSTLLNAQYLTTDKPNNRVLMLASTLRDAHLAIDFAKHYLPLTIDTQLLFDEEEVKQKGIAALNQSRLVVSSPTMIKNHFSSYPSIFQSFSLVIFDGVSESPSPSSSSSSWLSIADTILTSENTRSFVVTSSLPSTRLRMDQWQKTFRLEKAVFMQSSDLASNEWTRAMFEHTVYVNSADSVDTEKVNTINQADNILGEAAALSMLNLTANGRAITSTSTSTVSDAGAGAGAATDGATGDKGGDGDGDSLGDTLKSKLQWKSIDLDTLSELVAQLQSEVRACDANTDTTENDKEKEKEKSRLVDKVLKRKLRLQLAHAASLHALKSASLYMQQGGYQLMDEYLQCLLKQKYPSSTKRILNEALERLHANHAAAVSGADSHTSHPKMSALLDILTFHSVSTDGNNSKTDTGSHRQDQDSVWIFTDHPSMQAILQEYVGDKASVKLVVNPESVSKVATWHAMAKLRCIVLFSVESKSTSKSGINMKAAVSQVFGQAIIRGQIWLHSLSMSTSPDSSTSSASTSDHNTSELRRVYEEVMGESTARAPQGSPFGNGKPKNEADSILPVLDLRSLKQCGGWISPEERYQLESESAMEEPDSKIDQEGDKANADSTAVSTQDVPPPPLSIICDEHLLQNTPLISDMKSTQNFKIVERSLPPDKHNVVIIDPCTSVRIVSLTDLVISADVNNGEGGDGAVDDLVSNIVKSSLHFPKKSSESVSCWLIIEAYEKKRHWETRYMYDKQSIGTIQNLTAKLSGLDVRILHSSNPKDTAALIGSVCSDIYQYQQWQHSEAESESESLEGMAVDVAVKEKEKDGEVIAGSCIISQQLQSAVNMEWLHSPETIHEQLLSSLPGINALSSRLLLSRHTLAQLSSMSVSDLAAVYPEIPQDGLELMHEALHRTAPGHTHSHPQYTTTDAGAFDMLTQNPTSPAPTPTMYGDEHQYGYAYNQMQRATDGEFNQYPGDSGEGEGGGEGGYTVPMSMTGGSGEVEGGSAHVPVNEWSRSSYAYDNDNDNGRGDASYRYETVDHTQDQYQQQYRESEWPAPARRPDLDTNMWNEGDEEQEQDQYQYGYQQQQHHQHQQRSRYDTPHAHPSEYIGHRDHTTHHIRDAMGYDFTGMTQRAGGMGGGVRGQPSSSSWNVSANDGYYEYDTQYSSLPRTPAPAPAPTQVHSRSTLQSSLPIPMPISDWDRVALTQTPVSSRHIRNVTSRIQRQTGNTGIDIGRGAGSTDFAYDRGRQWEGSSREEVQVQRQRRHSPMPVPVQFPTPSASAASSSVTPSGSVRVYGFSPGASRRHIEESRQQYSQTHGFKPRDANLGFMKPVSTDYDAFGEKMVQVGKRGTGRGRGRGRGGGGGREKRMIQTQLAWYNK